MVVEAQVGPQHGGERKHGPAKDGGGEDDLERNRPDGAGRFAVDLGVLGR